MDSEIQTLKKKLNDAKHELLRKHNAHAIGIGYKYKNGKRTEQKAIIFFVYRKRPLEQLKKLKIEPVPETLFGYLTDVREIPKGFTVRSEKQKHRPFSGGVSGISIKEKGATGTLGLVSRKKGEVLSNNHVLCYDEDTEVLTADGFKPLRDVKEGEFVATLNSKENAIEFQPVLRKWRYRWNGYMIHFKNRFIDLLVTPNHKLWVRRAWNKKSKHDFTFKSAEEVYKELTETKLCGFQFKNTSKTFTSSYSNEFYLPTISYLRGKDYNVMKPIDVSLFAYFLGYWIGDGTLGMNKNPGGYVVMIRSASPSNLEKLKKVLNSLGFNPHVNEWNLYVAVNSKQLYHFLLPLKKKEGKGRKRFPRFILNWGIDAQKSFLDGYLDADGGRYHHYAYFSSVDKEIADSIQELAIRLGYPCKLKRKRGSSFNPRGEYWCGTICLGQRGCDPLFRNDCTLPKKVFYNGYVYSIEVPNHTILVRRNGVPCWSGNSNESLTISRTAEKGDKFIQPGYVDLGTENDVVGELDRWVDLIPIGAGTCPVGSGTVKALNFLAKLLRRRGRFHYYVVEDNYVDGAVGVAYEGMWEPGVMGLGEIKYAKEEPELGEKVMKRGRTTGLTKGVVTAVGVEVDVGGYQGFYTCHFVDQVAIEGEDGDFSQPGDSGSCIITQSEPYTLVGLLFAGGKDEANHDITIASPYKYVKEYLNYEP